MRNPAQETAPQITLRDCSIEVVGEGQYIRFWWRGSSMQSSAYFTKVFLLVTRSWCHHEKIQCFSRCEGSLVAQMVENLHFHFLLDVRRCKGWDHEISSWNSYLKTCSTSFPGSQSAPFLFSTLDSCQVCQQLQQQRIQSPGKKVKVTQSYPTLCDPMDYTVHEIVQARILEWVACPFSRGCSRPRDQTGVLCIACRWILYQLSYQGIPIVNVQNR